MSFFYTRLESHLIERGLTFYKLHYLAQIPSGQFSMWKKGARRPSDAEINRIAEVKDLGLSLVDLRAWRMIDEFSLEQLEAAVTEARKLQAEQESKGSESIGE
jgi:hypothetical protein